MQLKTFKPGDEVLLATKEKEWKGYILESYDSQIVLLKLESGYNIGIRESEIVRAKLLAKAVPQKKLVSAHVADEKLPRVAIIITGGTISSKLDPKSGGVIATDVEGLLQIAPDLSRVCTIAKVVSPFMKLSGNMDPSDWKKIATTCEKLLNDETIDGVIVTHGSDTISYTAAALAFFLGPLNKPVAVTYSQRSIDRGSTDASLNLLCAAKYAVSDIAEVAVIGHETTDDTVCLAMPATKTRKMHTSKRAAFETINARPLAKISKETFEILDEFVARDANKRVRLDAKYFEKVALIKIFPGQDPTLLDYYVREGYKGIILEVTGLGHVPSKGSKHNWIPRIKKAIQKKVAVCAAAATLHGRLNPHVYAYGRELEKTGTLFLEDMLSETALVKLGWILGHPRWKAKAKEKMRENIAREFSDRLED